MLRFLEKPNIPTGNVRSVLLGARYAALLEGPLAELGIRVISVEGERELDPHVSEHVDMLAHHLGNNEWIASKTAENALKCVENIKVYPVDVRLSGTYPKDIALNLLQLGGCVYGKLEHASPLLLEHLSGKGIKQVRVRQGYAKCSVCIVNDSAAITSDGGLAAAMREHGIDVLEISPGCVRLDGYDTGFIGGATGLIASNKLAFVGRLDSHVDAAPIGAFLTKHNVTPIELVDSELIDVGSILPLTEELTGRG